MRLTLGMGPENYAWCQCNFHAASNDIYNAGGKEVLIKWWITHKNHQAEMIKDKFMKMLQNEDHPVVAVIYLNFY